ncbi:MAG: extracellular solute-binding protein [Caldilineaceae bacterium]
MLPITRGRLCSFLALTLVFLAQCSRSAEPTPVASEPITLTMVSFNNNGALAAAEEYAIDQFQSQQPNVEFNRLRFNQSPRQLLNLSPAPDLMTMGAYYFLSQAAQENQLLDLTEIWAETGMGDAFPPGLQQVSAYEGKQYYLPTSYAWSAIYYNRALFDQYGLQPPRTWDEFLLLCETLITYGERPLSLGGQDAWLAMLWFDYLDLRMNGARFHRELLQGQIDYTDSRVRAVLETWSMLFAKSYFVARPEGVDDLSSLTALVRDDNGMLGGEKAAMTLVNPFWMGSLPDKFLAEFDFFPFPTMDPSIPPAEVLTTLGYMAPRAGENPPATLAFLTYLGSAEAQSAVAQHMGTTALWAPARNDIDEELLSPAVKQGRQLVAGATDVVAPYMLSMSDQLWPKVTQGLRRFLRAPDQIDDFSATLEEVRLEALDKGLLQSP